MKHILITHLCVITSIIILLFIGVVPTGNKVRATGTPLDSLETLIAKVKHWDEAAGDAYKNNVVTTGLGYHYAEFYYLMNYLYMYDLTGDTHWLDRLIDHSDAILNQRDNIVGKTDYRGVSAPVWTDIKPENYPKMAVIGFNGAMWYPMVSFSVLVADHPELKTKLAPDGQTYWKKAKDYAVAVSAGLSYYNHDFEALDNGLGYYRYPNDLPAGNPRFDTLRGKIAAHNYQGLALLANLAMSFWYEKTGNTTNASVYKDRVIRYTKYLKSRLKTVGSGNTTTYIWEYSDYYGPDSVENVGHGNIDILFTDTCLRHGIIFTTEDLQRFANTYSKNILSNGFTVDHELINGEDYAGYSKALYYWVRLSKYTSEAKNKSIGYLTKNSYPVLETVSYLHALGGIFPSPTPSPTFLPGDLDHNHKVNNADYTILINNFGKTGTPGWIPADINKDGKVNIFDYNILVGNFGK